jgi:hypothetical protein
MQDMRATFDSQFVGMTIRPYCYDEYEMTRTRLVTEIQSILTAEDRRLLLSVKRGEPDWHLYPVTRLQELPAVQWKLSNILKLKSENAKKHSLQFSALEKVLGG